MKLISLLLLLACCLTYGQREIIIDSLNKYFEINPVYLSKALERGVTDLSQLKNKKFEVKN